MSYDALRNMVIEIDEPYINRWEDALLALPDIEKKSVTINLDGTVTYELYAKEPAWFFKLGTDTYPFIVEMRNNRLNNIATNIKNTANGKDQEPGSASEKPLP